MGLSDEDLANLDGDWAAATPAERAAFTLARKLTYEPHRLADADFTELRKHYKDLQILEIIFSVSGNNATNRWKEGTGVPQSRDGSSFLRRAENKTPPVDSASFKSFLTPTSEKHRLSVSRVAPLQIDPKSGKPSQLTVASRPPLEPRADVEAALVAARKRSARLPVVSDEEARALLPEDWAKNALPQWVRLLANFPRDGKSRILGHRNSEEKGDLKPLVKAQVSWIIARQDRAWYAVGEAQRRLRALGQSDDQIYRLDGSWKEFTPADAALFTLARNLAATPIVLTDDDVAQALKLTGPREVVQLISYVTDRAFFDRVTEAANLPLEK